MLLFFYCILLFVTDPSKWSVVRSTFYPIVEKNLNNVASCSFKNGDLLCRLVKAVSNRSVPEKVSFFLIIYCIAIHCSSFKILCSVCITQQNFKLSL